MSVFLDWRMSCCLWPSALWLADLTSLGFWTLQFSVSTSSSHVSLKPRNVPLESTSLASPRFFDIWVCEPPASTDCHLDPQSVPLQNLLFSHPPSTKLQVSSQRPLKTAWLSCFCHGLCGLPTWHQTPWFLPCPAEPPVSIYYLFEPVNLVSPSLESLLYLPFRAPGLGPVRPLDNMGFIVFPKEP